MNTPLLKSNLLIKPSKPSIVRVGASAFLVLAAAVLTAASLLSPFARAQVEGCVSPSDRKVQDKTVNIKNNSGVPIYVVLEAAKQIIEDENNRPHDRWLQAEFNDLKGTYASTYLYRVYVNQENGIKKDESVSVTLPFYTKLESKPCPNKPDQYIDWWRALRIYVYDDSGAIKHAYDCDTKEGNVVDCGRDRDHPEKPNAVRISSSASPVPTCPACFAPLAVYRIQSGGDKHGTALPAEDPSQLLEYTFAKVTASPEPLKIDYAFVDYDISSVDQVYMSVAMDPVNNPFIGFIGSALGRDIFSDTLTKFRNDFSWPKYKWPPYVMDQTAIRLPATFNVMNDIAHPGFIACDKGPCPPLFEPAGAAIKALPVVQKMEKLWDECCGADWPSKRCQPSGSSETCDNMAKVAKLFDNNYASYKKLCETPGKTPVKLDRDQMLANVYGWVPFKSCLSGGDVNNELVNTPGIGGLDEYRKISHAYVDLQYHSPPDPRTFGDFNRYTQLIHGDKYLHVGEYAFSIDDAAGNMLEVGDGVNITVGGTNGLGNRNPYDPWRFFLFNVGAAKETGPTWTKYGVCTGTEEELTACADQAPDRDMRESGRNPVNGDIEYASIKIGAVQCPCVIVLEDSNKALYKVKVKKLPQPPPPHPINKEGKPPTATDNSWVEKVGDDFVNVGCFGTETSFEWCGGLNAYIAFDQAVSKNNGVQRSVYHVNASAPVVSKPGIRFEQGNVKGTLTDDRLAVTVTWPKAITQPPGRPVKYALTLWNRANCPKGAMLCNAHDYVPVPGTCNASQTECTVVFSRLLRPTPNAPPLTADTLKSMSVTARANGIQVGKEANFP